MSSPLVDARVGTTLLGKLRVVSVLGAGGMGVVYEVEHLVTGHRRALKVLRRERADDPNAVARLMREASIAGKVGGRRLVETYDVGRLDDGAPYLLMELLEGRTLADRLEAEGILSPPETVRIGSEIAEGLSAAHAAGVLHRDLTPRNVFLVREDDGREHVRLVDFGLSKMLAGQTDRFGHLTATGAFVGTPYYVSPEQAGGEPVDARADQYSLAVILYECLTGRRPYEGESLLEILGRIASGDHAPVSMVRPEVGVGVSRAVSRALSRRPADRFADVDGFVAALSVEYDATAALDVRRAPIPSAMEGSFAEAVTKPVQTPSSRPPGRPPASVSPVARERPRPVPRRRVGWWVAGFGGAGLVALLVAFGGTAWVMHRRNRATATERAPRVMPIDDVTPERLRELYMQRDFRRCIREGQLAPETVEVVTIVLECAEQAGSIDSAQTACQQLSRLAPDHPRAVRCRHDIQAWSRGTVEGSRRE